MINEDALARVLERMQREEGRFRPRWLDWLATGAAFLTIYFALTTATFRVTHGIASGDLHTFFFVIDVLLGLATVGLFFWWCIYGVTHLHKLTADELVAQLKQKADEQAGRKSAAQQKASQLNAGKPWWQRILGR